MAIDHEAHMSHLARVATNRALRQFCDPWRSRRQRIALVPTMGNLHAGHISLCRRAAELADRVIVTIFVNPTQFGPGEDFASYPRTLEDDMAALDEAQCADVLFVPAVGEIYPNGTDNAARLSLPALSGELCGASRPGHFEGVAGVVLRLCNIAQPHVLVLGEKDFQQLVLIRWLVNDLSLNFEVHGAPVVRNAAGLALSSRNRYLSSTELQLAPELQRTLAAVAADIRSGARAFEELEEGASRRLESHGFSVDYIEVRDAAGLRRPQQDASNASLIVLGAAKLGRARLIDNVRV
jgi:pantoate--beta-alanine ligase